MRRSQHVFVAGESAEALGREHGLARQYPEAFVSEEQRERLRAAGLSVSDRDGGTVGAVALDRDGHLAAATSTGGMRGQSRGRISDSAVIGAGTYADDSACAVSCTGVGEDFIRCGVAGEVALPGARRRAASERRAGGAGAA